MSTFDTFRDLFGDLADDYKKAWDDLLDREDDRDKGSRRRRREEKDATLSKLAHLPGFAGLPLGTAQALVNAGPAAPALLSALSGPQGGNPLAALAGASGAPNPLSAPVGAGGATPLAAAGNPMAALGSGAGANPLGALGGIAGAAGDTARLTETLVSLPGQIAQLTEAIGKLLSVLPGATASKAG